MKFLAALLLLLVGCAPLREAANKGTPRPNILFVYADDHAYQAISAYGSVINKTPNLDRLASEGILFRECYVTNSICGPMRAVVQTGQYSHRNGIFWNDERFDGSLITFPKLLQKAGYETALIGKWHLRSDPTGYDHWEILNWQGVYYNPHMRHPDQGTKHIIQHHTGYTTDIITDRALAWLKNRPHPEKPFLLMYQHKAPHRNWQPGPRHLSMYDDHDIPEPPTLFDDYRGRGKAAKLQDMSIQKSFYTTDLKLIPPTGLTAEQLQAWNAAYGPKNKTFEEAKLTGKDLLRWRYQRYIKDYLRCVASIDDNLGRVLDYLDQTGLAKNTVVVYTSDQGFFLGEHGWYDKRWMYEESLRTPLLIRWPAAIRPGQVRSEIVSPLDFAQTFLDMARMNAPSDMQGESLLPLLTGTSTKAWRDHFYYHFYEFPGVHNVRRHYGVVNATHKLIRFYERDVDEWELYDRRKDPYELKSVYADPAYAKIVANMKAALRQLQTRYGESNPEGPILRPFVKEVKPGMALHLARPDGKRRPDIDPSRKPLVVAAHIIPEADDGVLVSQGDVWHGFTLHLKDGIPRFGVRVDIFYYEVAGTEKISLHKPVHLAGAIDVEGKLLLYIDGKLVNTARGFFISRKPNEELTIGSDPGGRVDLYKQTMPFQGSMTDIRLYYGALPEETIRLWSKP